MALLPNKALAIGSLLEMLVWKGGRPGGLPAWNNLAWNNLRRRGLGL
jgi:hypothetical protein